MNMTEVFVKILRNIRTKEDGELSEEFSDEQWMELFRISQKQSVVPLIYEEIFRQPQFKTADQTLQNMWKMNTLQTAGDQARRTALFLMLYDRMTDKGLHPLIVKGIVCRELYPQPDLRVSNDEDLLIPREEFTSMDELLRSEGFVRETLEEGKEYQEVPYHHPGNGLYLEMHMDLFSKESGAYGHLNRLFTDVFEQAVTVEVQGTKVWTLQPQQHFLYLVCHGLKHFLHSGFGIRQVLDMMMFAEKYKKEIHWDELQQIMKENDMYVFTMNLLEIGTAYLGFRWEEIGCERPEGLQPDCMPLLNDMLDGGIFGRSNMNRIHSANITLNAAQKQTTGRLSGILASLFPGKEYIRKNYPYAQKFPVLIPLAYMHRIVNYLKHKEDTKEEGKNSTQIGNERVLLLKKYGIIQK